MLPLQNQEPKRPPPLTGRAEGGRYNGNSEINGNCNCNGYEKSIRRGAAYVVKAASSRRTPKLVGGGFLFGEVGKGFSLVG